MTPNASLFASGQYCELLTAEVGMEMNRGWVKTCMVAGLFCASCSAKDLNTPAPDGGTGSELDAGGAPDSGAGGTDSGGEPSVLPLPVTVSDYFAPSGYMGDGQRSPATIMIRTTGCKEPRPAGAAGDCYHVTYTPGPARWAGVYWQYPERNWGTSPGKRVEAGATKVTFHAAVASGSVVFDFIAGGENDPSLPYHDTFTVKKRVTLTTTLTSYQIDISGQSYEPGVLGAFAWAVEAPAGSSSPIEFYLDAIRWEK